MDSTLIEKTAKLFYRTIITKVIEPGLAGLGDEQLTQVQLMCMRFVYLHPDCSVGEIAAGLMFSNAASAKLIDRLVKKNILTRTEDPVDRRVLKIKLTASGDSLLEKAGRIEQEQFGAIIAQMSPEEVTALVKGLEAFLGVALVSAAEIEAVCLKCGWDHLVECPGNLRYRQLTGKDKINN
ncbi:MAG: MarR family transcriptional regulator [Bacillota bacterium]